jgi:hypothetical protein
MNTVKTDPDIAHCIIEHLKHWRNETATEPAWSFLIEGLTTCQERIGWHRLFEGRLSIKWMDAQQAYYKLIKSTRTGRRWMVKLIKKLWGIAWTFGNTGTAFYMSSKMWFLVLTFRHWIGKLWRLMQH